MSRIRVNISDTNNILRLQRVLNDLEQYKLRVGVFGEDDSGGKASYVMIASVHEFGAIIDNGKGIITIPERSFIRSTFDEKQGEWMNFLKQQIKLVCDFRVAPRDALERLGAKMVGDIQKKIRNLQSPPNAPSTIAAKGSSNPLIDTGGLRQRITYKVERA